MGLRTPGLPARWWEPFHSLQGGRGPMPARKRLFSSGLGRLRGWACPWCNNQASWPQASPPTAEPLETLRAGGAGRLEAGRFGFVKVITGRKNRCITTLDGLLPGLGRSPAKAAPNFPPAFQPAAPTSNSRPWTSRASSPWNHPLTPSPHRPTHGRSAGRCTKLKVVVQ